MTVSQEETVFTSQRPSCSICGRLRFEQASPVSNSKGIHLSDQAALSVQRVDKCCICLQLMSIYCCEEKHMCFKQCRQPRISRVLAIQMVSHVCELFNSNCSRPSSLAVAQKATSSRQTVHNDWVLALKSLSFKNRQESICSV